MMRYGMRHKKPHLFDYKVLLCPGSFWWVVNKKQVSCRCAGQDQFSTIFFCSACGRSIALCLSNIYLLERKISDIHLVPELICDYNSQTLISSQIVTKTSDILNFSIFRLKCPQDV